MTRKSISPRQERAEERSAGFVLFHDGPKGRRYLLLRHRDGGHWAFPKGRIELGERALDAARRETLEETGIGDVRIVPGFRAASRYRFARGDVAIEKSVEYYLGESDVMDVRLSDEHTDASWVDAAGAVARLTYDEARAVLRRAEAALSDSEERRDAER